MPSDLWSRSIQYIILVATKKLDFGGGAMIEILLKKKKKPIKHINKTSKFKKEVKQAHKSEVQ